MYRKNVIQSTSLLQVMEKEMDILLNKLSGQQKTVNKSKCKTLLDDN